MASTLSERVRGQGRSTSPKVARSSSSDTNMESHFKKMEEFNKELHSRKLESYLLRRGLAIPKKDRSSRRSRSREAVDEDMFVCESRSDCYDEGSDCGEAGAGQSSSPPSKPNLASASGLCQDMSPTTAGGASPSPTSPDAKWPQSPASPVAEPEQAVATSVAAAVRAVSVPAASPAGPGAAAPTTQTMGTPILVKIVAADGTSQAGGAQSVFTLVPAGPSDVAACNPQQSVPQMPLQEVQQPPSGQQQQHALEPAGRAVGGASSAPIVHVQVVQDGNFYAVAFQGSHGRMRTLTKAYSDFLLLYAKLSEIAENSHDDGMEAVLNNFPPGCSSQDVPVASRLEAWLKEIVHSPWGASSPEVLLFFGLEVPAEEEQNLSQDRDGNAQPVDVEKVRALQRQTINMTKQRLREQGPGRVEDFVPSNWDEELSPHLGDWLRFVKSAPDFEVTRLGQDSRISLTQVTSNFDMATFALEQTLLTVLTTSWVRGDVAAQAVSQRHPDYRLVLQRHGFPGLLSFCQSLYGKGVDVNLPTSTKRCEWYVRRAENARASQAWIHLHGCTDLELNEGMQLATEVLRNIRGCIGVDTFTDQELCEVFENFLACSDGKPQEALAEMKLQLWGPDRSRWPQAQLELGKVSAERLSKARASLVSLGTCGAAYFAAGAAVATGGAILPVMLVAGCCTAPLWTMNSRVVRKSADLAISPLAMDHSCWEMLDLVERGREVVFSMLVTLRGERWRISRSRTDFVQLSSAIVKRLAWERSGTYVVPKHVNRLFPSNFRSSKTQQVRFTAYLNGLIDCPLGQSILAETIHGFFLQTYEDKAKFGSPLSVFTEASLGASNLTAPPVAAVASVAESRSAASASAGMLPRSSSSAPYTPQPAFAAPTGAQEGTPEHRGNPFQQQPQPQTQDSQLGITIQTWS